MIKHAVKQHFQGVDDDLATNYFDKLIQLPIRVPPLGTQEVRVLYDAAFYRRSRAAKVFRLRPPRSSQRC
jgi:predicted KAP-like P-loop ATPase